jgi:hypothetical protein
MATYTTLAGACLSVIVSMSSLTLLAQPFTTNIPQGIMRGAAMPLSAQGRYTAWEAQQQLYNAQLAKITNTGFPTAAPSIISGKILTPSLDVKVAPANPKISFKYTSPGLFSSVQFWIESPSGRGFIADVFQTPIPDSKSGSMIVQRTGAGLGLYAEPGIWTLTAAYIYDNAGNAASYTGSQLLDIFPSVTITVKNNGTPDVSPPTVSAGEILTPTVSLSSKLPYFKARLTVADDVSGVSYIGMSFIDPSNNYYGIDYYTSSAVRSGSAVAGFNFAGSGAAPGTYTIQSYVICDVANNCLDGSLFDVMHLFGTSTFQVTQ